MQNLHCFIATADDKDNILLVYNQFCCKIKQFWGNKFVKLVKDK